MRQPSGIVASGSLRSTRASTDGSGRSVRTLAIKGVRRPPQIWGAVQSRRATRIRSAATDDGLSIASPRPADKALRVSRKRELATAADERRLRTTRAQRTQTTRASRSHIPNRHPVLLRQCGHISANTRSCRLHVNVSTCTQARRI